MLEQFGQGPLADCGSAEQLREHFSALLDELLATRFGGRTIPAVRIQGEQARLRLGAFADWQARWRRSGWRIHTIEKEFEDDSAFLLVDGRKMHLRGRIDRIDIHEPTGDFVVFDYKTSDTAQPPEATHRSRGSWTDFCNSLSIGICCGEPASARKICDWATSPCPRSPAYRRAIGRLVDRRPAGRRRRGRASGPQHPGGKFWPPKDEQAQRFAEFAAICQDDLFRTEHQVLTVIEEDES